ncbi:unnamed protein product [Choristocarpus tenellus]
MLIVMGGSRRAANALVSHVRRQLGGDDDSEPLAGPAGIGGGDRAGARGGGEGRGGGIDTARYVVVRKAGEAVPVLLDSEAFDVLLHDSLYTQLRTQYLHTYGVAYVECRVDRRGRGPPLLCAKPRADREGHPAMFLSVGDVNIVRLKEALEAAGISVELQAGKLSCAGGVTVQAGEGGKMDMEGEVGDTYYRVREILYNQYTIV